MATNTGNVNNQNNVQSLTDGSTGPNAVSSQATRSMNTVFAFTRADVKTKNPFQETLKPKSTGNLWMIG